MYLIQIKDELNNYFILNIKYMSKFYYRFENHALKLIDADLCLLKASWIRFFSTIIRNIFQNHNRKKKT